MDTIFSPFRGAHLNYNGYQLSETLLPGTSSAQVDQLRAFYRSTNAANVKNDIRYNILYDSTTSLKLSTEEGNAWVEVYVAFWKAVGEILKAEDAERARLKVWILQLLFLLKSLGLPSPCVSFPLDGLPSKLIT